MSLERKQDIPFFDFSMHSFLDLIHEYIAHHAQQYQEDGKNLKLIEEMHKRAKKYIDTTAQEVEEIRKWIEENKQSESPSCCLVLGLLFFTGLGVDVNEKQGIFFCKKAAIKGNLTAKVFLAYLNESPEKVLLDLKEAADLGSIMALNPIALRYDKGDGVAPDEKKAYLSYQLAAYHGDPFGIHSQGKLLFFGKGVAENKKEGVACCQKAADHGLPFAIKDLGGIYLLREEKKEETFVDLETVCFYYEQLVRHYSSKTFAAEKKQIKDFFAQRSAGNNVVSYFESMAFFNSEKIANLLVRRPNIVLQLFSRQQSSRFERFRQDACDRMDRVLSDYKVDNVREVQRIKYVVGLHLLQNKLQTKTLVRDAKYESKGGNTLSSQEVDLIKRAIGYFFDLNSDFLTAEEIYHVGFFMYQHVDYIYQEILREKERSADTVFSVLEMKNQFFNVDDEKERDDFVFEKSYEYLRKAANQNYVPARRMLLNLFYDRLKDKKEYARVVPKEMEAKFSRFKFPETIAECEKRLLNFAEVSAEKSLIQVEEKKNNPEILLATGRFYLSKMNHPGDDFQYQDASKVVGFLREELNYLFEPVSLAVDEFSLEQIERSVIQKLHGDAFYAMEEADQTYIESMLGYMVNAMAYPVSLKDLIEQYIREADKERKEDVDIVRLSRLHEDLLVRFGSSLAIAPWDMKEIAAWVDFAEKNNSGSPSHCFVLGLAYNSGVGATKNIKKGYEYYKKSDSPEALYQQASFLYAVNSNMSTQNDEVFRLLEEAARRGSLWALCFQAYCYSKGYGVPKDEKKAFALYCQASDKGFVGGLAGKGRCYKEGIGVLTDQWQGFLCYEEACATGAVSYWASLGVCYENGVGVVQDQKEAFVCYQRGAMRGSVSAVSSLARFYAHEKDVPKDSRRMAACLNKIAKAAGPYELTTALLLADLAEQIFFARHIVRCKNYAASIVMQDVEVIEQLLKDAKPSPTTQYYQAMAFLKTDVLLDLLKKEPTRVGELWSKDITSPYTEETREDTYNQMYKAMALYEEKKQHPVVDRIKYDLGWRFLEERPLQRPATIKRLGVQSESKNDYKAHQAVSDFDVKRRELNKKAMAYFINIDPQALTAEQSFNIGSFIYNEHHDCAGVILKGAKVKDVNEIAYQHLYKAKEKLDEARTVLFKLLFPYLKKANGQSYEETELMLKFDAREFTFPPTLAQCIDTMGSELKPQKLSEARMFSGSAAKESKRASASSPKKTS